METGNAFTINYTAINSHCNCTITPRFNGSLIFLTRTKTENCSTEIAIHRLQQSEFNTLITIPCKDGGRTLIFYVTPDRPILRLIQRYFLNISYLEVYHFLLILKYCILKIFKVCFLLFIPFILVLL